MTVEASVDTAPRGKSNGRKLHNAIVEVHIWLSILFSAILLVVSITGILINHKIALGLMPDVRQKPSAEFSEALPLAELARVGIETAGIEGGLDAINRMDVRPNRGIVKVRFRDPAITEITVDLFSGEPVFEGARGDVFMQKLHSGEIFGENWVLLSDFAAGAAILLIITGYWQWLWPRWRRERK